MSDFRAPAFYADPYPTYERLRAAGPFVQLGEKVWMTGRYEVAEAVLRERRCGKFFLELVEAEYPREQAHSSAFAAIARMIVNKNPPHHTRLRALLMKAFNATQVEEFTRLARDATDQFLAGLPPAGSADLMRKFAIPVPFSVILNLLGMRPGDSLRFADDLRALGPAFEAFGLTAQQIAAASTAADTLSYIFSGELRKRRQKPGTDLISRLLSVEIEGDRLTDEEIVANCIFLFAAGQDTTAGMLGNALIALHRHPQELARLKADESLLPRAVAECQRYDNSLQVTARMVLEDMEFDSHRFARGDTLLISVGAANRDPAKFEQPDRLIIDRTDQDSRMMAFGGGIHYCIGARLAQINLQVALSGLLRTLPGLRLGDPAKLRWRPSYIIRGVESLPGTW
ncbi:MAG: cytochrome P450 [Ramlibacter sp.]|nr:cytochrome P450 [Ramlibacter sp.]